MIKTEPVPKPESKEDAVQDTTVTGAPAPASGNTDKPANDAKAS